ncbi:hypothetical protein LR48_Vigan86s001400 [Vigna angularis]|uniref:Uncharacterized protein n=1 Tax=Phaseolus angularis TaxID=3914 RepID=A0A0L9T3W5_PHAAN|nr:hypothetical protein LR48_Vigan86s001400 [Vigna angularis]
MASSSGKRIKTIRSKRKDKEPERSYANKFVSRKHECHFKVFQYRRLLMERKAGLIPDFAPQFGEQLENMNWGRLATYPALANIAVFALNMEEGADFGDVESVLCVPGGHFQRNRNGDVVNIRRVDLTPLAKIQSIHKGQVATTEMIIGMYDTPTSHRWTMYEFHNMVAWPKEQAQGSRAEVAEASAMDDEDAFEDAEDDEEEEDSDDSMG